MTKSQEYIKNKLARFESKYLFIKEFEEYKNELYMMIKKYSGVKD